MAHKPAATVVKFEVVGGFDVVKEKLTPFEAADGSVVGYILPDGRHVRLVVALEVENQKTGKFTYVTSSDGMAKLGFLGLDYDHLDFIP
jgi:hypothetical protein